MLKMNIVDVLKCHEQATGIKRKYSIADMDRFNLYYGVINMMIGGEVCHLGNLTIGARVPDQVLEEYMDLELIDRHNLVYQLTDKGHELLAIWQQHYANTYGYDHFAIIRAWDAVPHMSFYSTSWTDHAHITRLMGNTAAAFERFYSDLRAGVPIQQAEKQLQYCPITNHESVVLPNFDGHYVTYEAQLLPTQAGFNNLLIAANYRGVKVNGNMV